MMRLPHTDNAEHLWAFKKGYRFAQQGKPLREMPLTIRTDRTLRDYFQQGYDQAQQQLAAQPGPQLTPKKRALWLLLTLVAGLATAKLMIDEMRQAPQAPTVLTSSPQTTPAPTDAPKTASETASITPSSSSMTEHAGTVEALPEQATADAITPQPVPEKDQLVEAARMDASNPQQPALKPQDQSADDTPTASGTPDFSLLDAEARAKQLQAAGESTRLPPVSPSTIQVVRAVLAAGVQNREPVGVLEDVVPKSMRRVYFFTQIKGAKGQTLIHRWRYGNRIMAEIRLPIRSDNFRTWSSKRMSPAWAGRWWVEVVDEQGQVLARKGFRYVR